MFGSDASRYAQDVQDHIDHGTSGRVAGYISETIQVSLKLDVYLFIFGDCLFSLVPERTLGSWRNS